MDPYLDANGFAARYGTVKSTDLPLVESLVVVVSDWIRARKPDLPQDDPAAQLVVFEVTRNALMYGDLGPYKSIEKRTAHSSRALSIDASVVERFITDRHKQMLGLSMRAAPRGHFKKCDY